MRERRGSGPGNAPEPYEAGGAVRAAVKNPRIRKFSKFPSLPTKIIKNAQNRPKMSHYRSNSVDFLLNFMFFQSKMMNILRERRGSGPGNAPEPYEAGGAVRAAVKNPRIRKFSKFPSLPTKIIKNAQNRPKMSHYRSNSVDFLLNFMFFQSKTMNILRERRESGPGNAPEPYGAGEVIGAGSGISKLRIFGFCIEKS